MSEKLLNSLMQLFALIANPATNQEVREYVVKSFLREQLNTEQVKKYLKVYNQYYKEYQQRKSKSKEKKYLTVSSVKLLTICTLLNKELTQKEKYIVLIRLLEFIKSDSGISDQAYEFISTVATTFLIKDSDFLAIKRFVLDEEDFFKYHWENTLIISGKAPTERKIKFLYSSGLKGRIIVFYIDTIKLHIFKLEGIKELYLNQQILHPQRIYILSYGAALRNSRILPIYYSDIISAFTIDKIKTHVVFEAFKISYSFPSKRKAIHELSFLERSGKLVGIMGASGSGKTTLLKLLNGNYEPESGQILINGIDIHKQKEQIQGLIGYVPQEDFLIEELTVFENLYFNAKLSFGDLNEYQIKKKVIKILQELGLYHIKDQVVGPPLNRQISGGQRKRLNIALELLREPPILFLDEPTSGLSSLDSENIMDLLKELTLKGKLIFVVIHQPSSDIYKMFDRMIILDHGGYMIYNGPPIEAISYFKGAVHQANMAEVECPVCGTVKPEQIFNIVEAKVLDEYGRPTNIRKISPQEWYNKFKEYETKLRPKHRRFLVRELPSIPFNIPSKLKQFRIFLARDFLAKLSSLQYILLNALETPLLALLLTIIIKYWNISNKEGYLLYNNENVPVYLFMAVIIALFIGITVSAQEIIKDREIKQRESFLNLSHGSYLFAKVTILMLLSAFQALVFVLIANNILEIKHMNFSYWLLLFSLWVAGNMMGLNISDGFKNTVSIYIAIPFLIIPQLVLSGVLVKFDKLNPKIISPVSIPWYGEMMTARWGYEALAVKQFKDNEYEKLYYDYEKEISKCVYVKDFWYSELINRLNQVERKIDDPEAIKDNLRLIKNELSADYEWNGIVKKNFDLNKLTPDKIDKETISKIDEYLKAIKTYYIKQMRRVSNEKNKFTIDFMAEYSPEYLTYLKLHNHNEKLEDFVKNNDSKIKILEYKGRLYRKTQPIYYDGQGWLIKAHYYAPTKQIFGHKLDTFWVNIIVIWFQTFILFIMLYYRVLYKFIRLLEITGEVISEKMPRSKKKSKKHTRRVLKYLKWLT